MRRIRHPASLKKKKRSSLASAMRWLAGLLAALWISWAIFLPKTAGSIGLSVHEFFLWLLGKPAYLVPPFLFYLLAFYFKPRKGTSYIILGTGLAVFIVSITMLSELLGSWIGYIRNIDVEGPVSTSSPVTQAANLGGVAGKYASHSIGTVLGNPMAALAGMAGLLFGSQVLFGVPWSKIGRKVWQVLKEDLQVWIKARREFKALKAAAHPSNAPEICEGAGARISPPTGQAPGAGVSERASGAPTVPSLWLGAGASGSSGSVPRAGASSVPGLQPGAVSSPPEKKTPLHKIPYNLPLLDLLEPGETSDRAGMPLEDVITKSAGLLESTLGEFDIQAKVTSVSPGPVITRYELTPAPGVKVSSIVTLSRDIALAMKARGIRVVAPIPGKSAIGVELPNPQPALVRLREILESPAYHNLDSLLPFCLGRAAEGTPTVADIAPMPHILIAGATNSGKSVLIHDLILSVLYRAFPDEVKMLLVDPKRLELTLYDGIPHLYDPKTPCDKVGVITQPKDAAKSLKMLIKVMETRYDKFSARGVRNIKEYNKGAADQGWEKEFYILVVIDELADLMLIAQDMMEDSIQRLAQMARAVGIHLVLSTQRPSVDVLTGVIKANLTTRVALQVISKVDSRVILDTQGAEELLGRGDMLYLATGAQKPVRFQAPYVSESEIKKAVEFVKAQGKPSYPDIDSGSRDGGMADAGEQRGAQPEEIAQALKLVLERRRVSQDLLKAHFGSSAKATDILSVLEVRGFIHKPEGTNRWEIFYDKIEAELTT